MTAETVNDRMAVKPPFAAVLRNRRFRAVWLSQFVSGIGDWLVVGLLIPLVSALTQGSSFAVAGIMIAKIIPALLFSSVTGVFVDRFDRRKLMIGCDVVRAALTLVLLFTNSLAVIYLTVLVMEIASLFFTPARNALIPRIVADDEVAVANSLSYTTNQASMLIGLTMSGAILATFESVVRRVLASDIAFVLEPFQAALLGPRAGVVLNSLTFVLSALLLWSIHVDVRVPRDDGRLDLSLIGRDAVQSFRFLGEHRELRGLLVTVGMAILGGGAIITVGMAYVTEILAGGIDVLEQFEAVRTLVAAPQTFVLVLLALGMAGGAIVVPRLVDRVPLELLFLGAVTTFGVAMLLFAMFGVYWVALLFGITAGFCIGCLTVAGNTLVVRTVSDEIRGRVFTAMESVIRVSLLLSMVLISPLADGFGYLIERFGPEQAWLTGPRMALIVASLIVLGAAYYAYRTLNWRTAEAEAENGD